MNAQAEVMPVREIVERLISYRDGIQGREARELIAEAANRLLLQENELFYAYGVVNFGFEYGSFDFSVLRTRAAAFDGKGSGTPKSAFTRERTDAADELLFNGPDSASLTEGAR